MSCAPGAVARSKALLRSFGPQIDESTIARSIQALSDAWDSQEAQDGISAFFDKKTPPWIDG
jgi:methylglutaconyl-CoA hydratase